MKVGARRSFRPVTAGKTGALLFETLQSSTVERRGECADVDLRGPDSRGSAARRRTRWRSSSRGVSAPPHNGEGQRHNARHRHACDSRPLSSSVPRIVTDDCEFPAGIGQVRRLEKPPLFALFPRNPRRNASASSAVCPEVCPLPRGTPTTACNAAKHSCAEYLRIKGGGFQRRCFAISAFHLSACISYT